MNTFAIVVGCSKTKKSYRCKASEMYSQSVLFSKTVDYIKMNYEADYLILSAKHGIITKDTIIDPYDVTTSNPTTFELMQNVKTNLEDYNKVIAFCGKNYVKILRKVFPTKCIVEPLKGMGIGKRLQFLSGVNQQ